MGEMLPSNDDAARSAAALESAYLAARDVYGGSGFRGDAWLERRK